MENSFPDCFVGGKMSFNNSNVKSAVKARKVRYKKSTTRLIAFGFAMIILLGTILLTLPISVRSGKGNLLNSLFTATSATCVTGLAVADTYQNWTTFGQIVILCLVQVGGLGFMTIGAFIAVLLKKRIGLQEREQLQESVNTLELAGVVRLVKKIVYRTFLVELLGAILLSFRFIPAFGPVKGIYFAVFHAVSAFCNGGFDLMGINEAYSSLVAFEGDVLVNLVVVALIIIGGIGFIVWDDIARNKWHFKKYLLHSKIVLSVTMALTVGGTLLFLITENHAAFEGMSPLEKLLGALFSAVTPRTAGFNTVDTAALSNAGKVLTIILMFIGGSPGSTAGGVKTTTTIVLLFYAFAMITNREDINLFGRRLTNEVVKKANAVVIINLSLAIIAGVAIMMSQPLLKFEDVLFEVFSAIGTVGMTTGITRDLNILSRLIIIVLMYCGRLGSLSFALVFAQKNKSTSVRQPQEKIIIG